MKVPVYDYKLKKTDKTVELNDAVWGTHMNKDLVSQSIHVYSSNKRQGDATAKTRGEVRGGGRKPWKQKGTGRARHGSIRSPLWVGGGVTFPPTKRVWSRKMNKKMKSSALSSVLSDRLKKESLIIVDAEKINRGSFNPGEKYLLITDSLDVIQNVRNLENVTTEVPSRLNSLTALKGTMMCVDKKSVEIIEKRVIK